MVRGLTFVAAPTPVPIYTSRVLAFDPSTTPGVTYRLVYSGDKSGSIDMGTNTQVLISNVNVSVDWDWRAFSMANGITSVVWAEYVMPGLDRIAVWKSNGVVVVSWYGRAGKNYSVQSSSPKADGPWQERLVRPGADRYESWVNPTPVPQPTFYRYQVK